VKGSKFVAWLAPAIDLAAARDGLVDRSRLHPDATHHGWAYRIWNDGRIEAAGFDAGEPAGTTGPPILGGLERADIVSALCVVSRWFGGTKLGTGRLTRAYAEAARAAVTAAEHGGLLHPVEPWTAFRLDFPYQVTAGVRRVLARYLARERSAEYGGRVALVVSVPEEDAPAFQREISEGTGAAVAAVRIGVRLEAARDERPG
jgi:putative IMPACT (imprinted ancient) family translation regulator